MRVIIPLIAAALIFVGCEKSEDKAQEAASEQGAKVATSASIKGKK
jgi:putative lipoprotein